MYKKVFKSQTRKSRIALHVVIIINILIFRCILIYILFSLLKKEKVIYCKLCGDLLLFQAFGAIKFSKLKETKPSIVDDYGINDFLLLC